MKKNTIKIISVLLLVITLLCNISFADDASYKGLIDSEITTLENPAGDDGLNGTAKSIVGTIITIVRVIGVGIALIILIVLAMKYMMAAPGDKADVKKHAVPFIVGATVLFAATGILGIIEKFAVSSIK